MITFLEYVCERLLGPPAYRAGGRSYWLCPRHADNSPSFCTLPHKAEFKDRFRCFACGLWGDEYDLLRELHPDKDYPWQRVRLDMWRQDYEREVQSSPVSILRGGGSPKVMKQPNAYDRDPRLDEFSAAADAAIAELLEYMSDPELPGDQCGALKVAERALEICGRHGLHPIGFAGRIGGEVWFRESDAEHTTACTDPDCEAAVCRAKRQQRQRENRVFRRNGRR